jgi:catechol 2,3-dioxygenase
MPASMRIGPPTLRVKDLREELSFYEEILGLQVNRKYRTNADDLDAIDLGFSGKFKGAAEPLLILKHDPNAKAIPNNFAGLFHFAILVPDRKRLACAYSALQGSGVVFEGFADHLVSESLYLNDPERNGIEIYRDRSRDEWPRDQNGQIVMDTLPLDIRSLEAELNGEERENATPFPNGARIGHIHLRVTNLERSLSFYRENLGLDMTADWRAFGAVFLSAGGYHHHLGMNTWHSAGGPPHKNGEAGLDSFMIHVKDSSFIDAVLSEFGRSISPTEGSVQYLIADPNGIPILINLEQ